MQTVDIKDVYKSATEVTSFASTDRVFALNENDKFVSTRGFINRININDHVDLNTLTETAIYSIAGSNHPNAPTADWLSRSQMLVLKYSDTTCIQLIFVPKYNQSFQRCLFNYEWTPWVRLATDSSYVPPISEGG